MGRCYGHGSSFGMYNPLRGGSGVQFYSLHDVIKRFIVKNLCIPHVLWGRQTQARTTRLRQRMLFRDGTPAK